MSQNPVFLFLRFIVVDIAGDFLYFPLWWYTAGWKKSVVFTVEKIRDLENALAIKIWAKNLFRPMYAQYDLQGRIISFFMRLFQLIIRSIFFFIFFVFLLFVPVIWFFLPLFVLAQIVIIFKTYAFGGI